jgi:hypothetical protein
LFGRLAPGVTLARARAEFTTIAQRLEQAYPASNTRVGFAVHPGLGRDTESRASFAASPSCRWLRYE